MITTINTAVLFVIIIITAILGYFAGLRRAAFSEYDNAYDEGFEAGIRWYEEEQEANARTIQEVVEDMVNKEKQEKAKQLIDQLDELFREDEEEDNVEILDGGEY
jgi:cell shape-determining protein MreC